MEQFKRQNKSNDRQPQQGSGSSGAGRHHNLVMSQSSSTDTKRNSSCRPCHIMLPACWHSTAAAEAAYACMQAMPNSLHAECTR
jgi:hypothetical protein